MKNNTASPYLRVGTSYYKKIEHPLASKDKILKIIPWEKTAIVEDHGKDYQIKRIPKYDSFCLIPDHLNYKREVNRVIDDSGSIISNGSYNLYEPIEWEIKEGNTDQTTTFLKHIFDEQYDIGLDYLTIIFRFPTQILPIFCMVSTERSTGKTTFLNWIKLIYKNNMTINNNEDFRNQFNSGWVSKLIIGVDEVLLDKKEDAEKIKNLSTSRSIKSEAKGRDKVEQEFFGKFILCSNNETDFIKISPDEIRFWIRKIPTIGKENIKMLDDLKKEIPAFLHFLKTRKIVSGNVSRMWFSRSQLSTAALKNVFLHGTSKLEREIKSLITDQILSFSLEEIKLTPTDIIELLKRDNNFNAQKTDVIEIVKNKWELCQENESKYYTRFYQSTENEKVTTSELGKTGRYYTFIKSHFLK